jgi:hypothetical protein
MIEIQFNVYFFFVSSPHIIEYYSVTSFETMKEDEGIFSMKFQDEGMNFSNSSVYNDIGNDSKYSNLISLQKITLQSSYIVLNKFKGNV